MLFSAESRILMASLAICATIYGARRVDLAVGVDSDASNQLLAIFQNLDKAEQYQAIIDLMHSHSVNDGYSSFNRGYSYTNSEGNHGDAGDSNTSESYMPLHTSVHDAFDGWSGAVSILDVGGGRGAAKPHLESAVRPNRLDYSCIDVTYTNGVCSTFSGSLLPFQDKSQDLVVFHYVLHHAADGDTITLLQEAYRVTRKYVMVAEDLQGETPERGLRNFFHEATGLFRGQKEWRQLFELVGFRALSDFEPRNKSEICYNTFLKAVPVWYQGLFVRNAMCKYEIRNRLFVMQV